jgi:hypothetical protein
LNQLVWSSTRSVTNILNAFQVISTFLRTEFESSVPVSRRFYAYFINQVKLVRIKTHSVAHALKVFETINDRGVGLDPMDLLKNLMFMRAKKDDYDALKDKWKGLVDMLYRANEKPLRFLRYFIFASYDVDRLREDQIYTWFSRNEEKCGYGEKPLDFVGSLVSTVSAYTHFVKGKNSDGSSNRYLANIRSLSGAARQHLILLLAGRHLPKDDFIELSRQLENLFFAFIITREPTREFERLFANWAPLLRKVTTRAELDVFIDEKIRPAKHNLATRFRLAFQELDESSIQKYRMRYVLGKLTQYVNEQAYGETEIDLDQFISQRDVEHILPQRPGERVIAEFDLPEDIHEYIPRLGNMTLLEHDINRSIQAEPYSVKREAYPNSHFLLTRTIAGKVAVGANTTLNRAVAGLITFEKWTSKSIANRQEMLTRLAHKVWEMPESESPTIATYD